MGVYEPGHLSLLRAMIELAQADLRSEDPHLVEDAVWFFSKGGGLAQWLRMVGVDGPVHLDRWKER